jgi:hypothetical protein
MHASKQQLYARGDNTTSTKMELSDSQDLTLQGGFEPATPKSLAWPRANTRLLGQLLKSTWLRVFFLLLVHITLHQRGGFSFLGVGCRLRFICSCWMCYHHQCRCLFSVRLIKENVWPRSSRSFLDAASRLNGRQPASPLQRRVERR